MLVQHDRVRARGTLDQSLRLQRWNLVRESERAGPRQLIREPLRRDREAPGLAPDQRMRPLDGHREPQVLRGGDDVARVALADREGGRYREHQRLSVSLGGAGALERFEVGLEA